MSPWYLWSLASVPWTPVTVTVCSHSTVIVWKGVLCCPAVDSGLVPCVPRSPWLARSEPGHTAPVSLSFAVVLRRALPAVPTCGPSYSSAHISLLLRHLPLVDVCIKPLLSIVCLFSLFKIGQKLDAISAVDILPGKIIRLCVNFLLGFQSIKIERAKGDGIGATTVFKFFAL